MNASQLVAAFGQESGTPLVLGPAGTVALQFDTGLTLHLEHDAGLDVLHCYTVLGEEPADASQRSRLHALLLSANAFGRDTEGASLGVDEATGEVVLSRRLDLRHTEPALLRDCVASMVSVAGAWRERLSHQPADTGAAGSDAAPHGPEGPAGPFGQFV